REEGLGAADVRAAAAEDHAARVLAAEGAMRGDRRPELARELRGRPREPLGPEADGPREERLSVRQDEHVARHGAEIDDGHDALGERRHETDEAHERERAEAHALRLDAERALDEVDPLLDVDRLG